MGGTIGTWGDCLNEDDSLRLLLCCPLSPSSCTRGLLGGVGNARVRVGQIVNFTHRYHIAAFAPCFLFFKSFFVLFFNLCSYSLYPLGRVCMQHRRCSLEGILRLYEYIKLRVITRNGGLEVLRYQKTEHISPRPLISRLVTVSSSRIWPLSRLPLGTHTEAYSTQQQPLLGHLQLGHLAIEQPTTIQPVNSNLLDFNPDAISITLSSRPTPPIHLFGISWL